MASKKSESEKTPVSKSKSGGAKPQRAAPPERNRDRNSLWARLSSALICLLLALFVILGIAGVDALVIALLHSTLTGLMGYGIYLLAPALLVAAYLYLIRQKEKVSLRLFCVFLLPFLLAGLGHVLFVRGIYSFDFAGAQLLWADGQALQGGGAISGALAEGLTRLFSRIGAFFILALALLFASLAAFRITPEKIVKAARLSYQHSRRRRSYEQDEFDEPDEGAEDSSGREVLGIGKRKPLDLELDERTGEVLAPAGEKRRLFARDARAPRPHEVVEQLRKPAEGGAAVQASSVNVAPPDAAGEAHPPIPAPEAEPEYLEEALTELSKTEKKQLIREELRSVSRDIASSMGQTSEEYSFPQTTLLHQGSAAVGGAVEEELTAIKKRLADTIASFGIEAKITGAVRGPSVTRYELELEQGVRLNRLTNLSDDIALALGASGVRIAPVPGKISLVGVEVPNQVITAVSIREVIESRDFQQHKSKVAFAVGKDIGGNYIIGDAARLPHLLIAGTTGSGKSVCTNSLIISLLFKASPEEVRLIMVDPKMVELGIYNGIPHLLIPVVTDPKKAAGALQWAVTEMMKRYRLFSEAGVRELSSYNAYAQKQEGLSKLPQIVVVIDELADLMLVAAKEVEESICRVAQMGRAAGMHLIIATQRPSADVITGLMKANIPSRIAFAVASALESRIILDTQGAEKLVGKGDMLWFPLGAGKPLRVQGCLIDDREVSAVVEQIKANSATDYDEAVLQEIEQNAQNTKGAKGQGGSTAAAALGEDEEADELFPAAVDIILELGQASASMLQRRLKLGYARASRLIDQMEDRGIVGPHGGSKPRQILMSKAQWDAMQGRAGEGEVPSAESPERSVPGGPGRFDASPMQLPEEEAFDDPAAEEGLPPWEEE